jgi:outer membrane protein
MVIRVLLVVLLTTLTTPVWGQELKVGFVNLQKAISESQRGKDARQTFQAALKDKQDALLNDKKDIQQQRKDLEKQAVLMKQSERAKAERRFQLRVRDYERKMRDVQEELRLREREITDEILKDLQKIITEVGKTGKFTMILERSQLLYTDKGTDITDDVIVLYNKRFQKKPVDKNR